MSKKRILILLVIVSILGGTWYYFFGRKVNFPDFDYHHAAVLRLDRNIPDSLEESLLPINDNGTNGSAFINKKGYPIHEHYIRTTLTSKQLDEIHDCLDQPWSAQSKTDCHPIYRDIVIYYDNRNKPVGWLALCFECRHTYFFPNKKHIANSSYPKLEEVFKKFKDVK